MIDYGRTALLAFSTTLFVITGAAAQSERLLVNMPKGFCRIERQLNATESAMVYKLDGGPSAMVAIAAVYVDCPSMPLFAKGAYGDVKRWAVIATGRSETRITSRKDFVDSFANNYVIDSGELLDRLYGAVDAYTANFATNPKHGRDQPTTLGIIDRDDRAIYKASIINLGQRHDGRRTDHRPTQHACAASAEHRLRRPARVGPASRDRYRHHADPIPSQAVKLGPYIRCSQVVISLSERTEEP